MNEQPGPTGTDASPVSGASPVPNWDDSIAAVSANKGSGLDAIPELAKSMQGPCPGLAQILQSSAVRTSLEVYKRQDNEAVLQEDKLKQELFWSNLCLLAAGVTSGLILAVSANALQFAGVDSAARKWPTLVLGLVTLALGAGAAYFGYIARDQGRIARWQTCRSEAEVARLDVFQTISSKAAAAGSAVAFFGLAVVVRHLLDDQRLWLGLTAIRHRKSSERTSQYGALASALAFIGGSGAIIASQTEGSGAIWIVLAGVIGAAIGAYAANQEALNRDRANAERYDKTLVAMDAIASRTDEVANSIASEPKALEAFTKTITDLLAAENQQWLDGTAQANAALDKLDAQLAQLVKPKGSEPSPAMHG